MLFYFTGTGNSLYAAKKIEDNPISIPQVINSDNPDFTADTIGIDVRYINILWMVDNWLPVFDMNEQKAIGLAVPEKGSERPLSERAYYPGRDHYGKSSSIKESHLQ